MKKEYLAKIFKKDEDKLRVITIEEDELFRFINEWHQAGTKVALYEIKQCLLDWS